VGATIQKTFDELCSRLKRQYLRLAPSGRRQAREHVFEQPLSCREARLRELADNLRRGCDELCAARGLYGTLGLALEALSRRRLL
jgi:hypothetical protein